ncbi:MAG: AMP-binding protein [Rhodospirillaceae bacterium]|nr:AMP-binding protein [Rhodospirillaceae bacterium]
MSTRALDEDRTSASGAVIAFPADVPAHGDGTLNIADRILRDAMDAGYADRACLIDQASQWTYRALDERSNRIAHVLTYDFTIEPGDRIILHAASSPMAVACWLAVVKVGAVAVIAAPLLRARELARVAKVSGARMCLCDAKLSRTVEEVRQRVPQLADIITFNGGFNDTDPDPLEARKAGKPKSFDASATAAGDPCVIAFATGDAGPARAAWHSHADMAAIVDATAAFLDLGPDDRVCGTLAACTTVGLTAMVLAPLSRGASVHLAAEPTAVTLRRAMAQDRATLCMTTPTLYRQLIAAGSRAGALPPLRKAISTGERLPPTTAGLCGAALGTPLTDAVEATEVGGIILAGEAGGPLRPLPGYQASVFTLDGTPNAIDIPGRLHVRGLSGGRVWQDDGRPAATRQDWCATGDLCVSDGSGAVRLLGRLDDALLPDGRILPLDTLEDTLLSHRGVADCAVLASCGPDGEAALHAFVAAAGDLPDPRLEDRLKGAIAGMLDGFGGAPIALRLHLMERLPRSEGGKLQREKLPAA